MRKLIIFVIFVACIVVFFLRIQEDEEIRVRVIPSSDASVDLKRKEQAKDITICYLKEAYDKDYHVFLKNIKNTMNDFELALKKELQVPVQVDFGNHTLYNKTYNNSAVKNTEEMTLYVIIGEGRGSNWWGTVYPEFLKVNSSEEVKYESLILSIFKKIKGE